MAEFELELTIDGELTAERVNALYEAGCDDMTFSSIGNVVSAMVTREAPSLEEAIVSAIETVESVSGLRAVVSRASR
jgi:hypothetical protein